MSENLDKLVEKIRALTDPISKQLKDLGSTKETIDFFFKGEEITICPYCGTFNYMEINYDEISEFSEYQCRSCLRIDKKYW